MCVVGTGDSQSDSAGQFLSTKSVQEARAGLHDSRSQGKSATLPSKNMEVFSREEQKESLNGGN